MCLIKTVSYTQLSTFQIQYFENAMAQIPRQFAVSLFPNDSAGQTSLQKSLLHLSENTYLYILLLQNTVAVMSLFIAFVV